MWDIRTFHLLRTVPALDQCAVVFPKTGRTFYAVTNEREVEGDNAFDTSFKTLDAYDYSNISNKIFYEHNFIILCNLFNNA